MLPVIWYYILTKMIIDIFLIMLIVTLALIILGSYLDISAITIVGIAFLFMLGIIILNPSGIGGIDYKTGDIITETNATSSVITHTYTTYDDRTFGVFLGIISVIWFIVIFINIRRGNKDED
jgi:hypothetical protein